MPRARNPNRDKAKELYLASKGRRPLVEIAKELGVSSNEIRKWKSMDKWVNELPSKYRLEPISVPKKVGSAPKEKERSKTKSKSKNAPKKKDAPKKKSVPKKDAEDVKVCLAEAPRKGGAPKGNKNAVGNKGGRPPKGNKNALKHGGYSKIFWEALDDEERELLQKMEIVDEEAVLIDEIHLFSLRERRIMLAIKKYKTDPKYEKGLYVESVQSQKTKRIFEGTPEEIEAQKARYRVLEEAGEVVPGVELKTTTRTEATAKIIARLEQELTSIQSQKSRAIASLNQIRNEKFKQEVINQKLPLEIELLDANIERTDAQTNKILGTNTILEDLSETDQMLYGEDGEGDAEPV